MTYHRPLKSLGQVWRKLADRHHRHGCESCRLTYSCHCGTPEVNGRCQACRSSMDRALWDRDLDPRPCCVTAQQVIDPDELLRYRLAGPGPWYRCRECSRTNVHIKRGLTT